MLVCPKATTSRQKTDLKNFFGPEKFSGVLRNACHVIRKLIINSDRHLNIYGSTFHHDNSKTINRKSAN